MPEEQIIVQLNPDVPPTGSDLGIVNAARRSFGKRSEWDYTCFCGIKKVPDSEYNKWVGCGADQMDCHRERKHRSLKDKDKRLLEFLARGMTADDFDEFVNEVSVLGDNDNCYEEQDFKELKELLWQWRNTPTHDTPFNHGFFSFEIKAPIFVRAQLVKHEYLIMSEFSRRYITDDIEFYQPTVWRKAAADVKQGSSEESVDWITTPSNLPAQAAESMLGVYSKLLVEGVAPEQARMVLPQSLMTSWTWSGTLGAFAKMCTLRIHPEAQYEAQLVAQQVYKYLKEYYPVGAKALVEGV